MKLIKFFPLVLALMLSACATNSDVKVAPINDFIIVHPDPVPTLELEPVEWQIWTLDRIIAESKNPENKDKTYYVLAPEQANALFGNLIEISDVMKKSKESILHYKNSVDAYNAKKAEDAKAAAESEADKDE